MIEAQVRPVVKQQFIDMAGACQYTSLSRRTLDYARADGELPYIKKGKKVIFNIADLDSWMNKDKIDVTKV